MKLRRALRLILLVISAAAALPLAARDAPLAARDVPVTEAELASHIAVLASDAFAGRLPGGDGEAQTIAYLTTAFARAGLEPLPNSATPWLQPVPLVERRTIGGSASFMIGGRAAPVRSDQIALTSRDAAANVAAPMVYVGYGVDGAGHITADVAGKVAVMLTGNVPFGTNQPQVRDRQRLLARAGAAAVLIVAPRGVPWAELAATAQRRTVVLASSLADAAPISGFLTAAGAAALVAAEQGDWDALAAAAQTPDFVPVPLRAQAVMTARAEVRAFASPNIIARLPGANPDGRAVVVMGHWDHLGLCGPADAADRICNGAVDNASGLAVMIAVAGRLATGPRPDRDVLFVATTAEEVGLLGATHFALNPPLPLDRIALALNIDTIAIAPRGTPVAVIGRGNAAVDAAIAKVAAAAGRTIDADGEADAFVQRQDGWALAQRGVPTVMVGGSFSDMALLNQFLRGAYHTPADQPGPHIELGGAAEDSELHIALVRHFAGRASWP